jgi:hypothetical protein
VPDHAPIRIGVRGAGSSLPGWQARCLDRLTASGDVTLAAVISAGGREEGPPPGRTWSSYLRRWGLRRSAALRPVDRSALLDGLPSLSDREVDRIRGLELDVILNLADSEPAPALVDAAGNGVWAFRHGDPADPRWDPACFWEVYRREPVTTVSLVRLTSDRDRVVVLHRGDFRTHGWSFVRNVDAVGMGSAEWPAQICSGIRHLNRRMPEATTPYRPAIRRPPGPIHLVRLALSAIGRIAVMQAGSIFSIEQWNVGIVEAPIERFLDRPWPGRVRWLPQRVRHRFVADPFGFQRDGRVSVVMEEWDHHRRSARLVTVDWDGNGGFSNPERVMDPSFHVSYPFLLEWDGALYCIPETGRLHRVDLYRCLEFPGSWEKAATLVEDFPAQDPTVVRHDDRWWLLCGRRRLAATELHAWYADELSGPWHPHPGNPLKTDIRSGRPGGTPFVHQGVLYRPAQDGSRTYGGAVTLNRVLRLTPTEFEEEPVTVVHPDPRGPYGEGVHTMSAAGTVTLVDAKRAVFVWAAFRHRLGARVRDLGGGKARASAGLNDTNAPGEQEATP